MMLRKSLTMSHKQTHFQQVSKQQPPSKTTPPLLLPEFYHWAWWYAVWNMPLTSSVHLSWLHLLPACCPPIAYLLEWGQGEGKNSLNTVYTQQQPKHCVIQTILVANPNHKSIHRLLWRKLSPSQPDHGFRVSQSSSELIHFSQINTCMHGLEFFCVFRFSILRS